MNSVKISLTSVRVSSVLPSLIDRLGDSKDQVRDQDQALLLKIMDQAANPQVQHTHVSRVSERRSIAVWSFQPLNSVFSVRVGANDGRLQAQEQPDQRRTLPLSHLHAQCVSEQLVCLNSGISRQLVFLQSFLLCFVSFRFGSQSLTLSKIVPHICNLLGDPTSQVQSDNAPCWSHTRVTPHTMNQGFFLLYHKSFTCSQTHDTSQPSHFSDAGSPRAPAEFVVSW